jgi:peptidyl-prolyl cis-trans isomerase D
MFEFFRRYMKLFMGVLLVPLVIGFVLFGVQGYNRFDEGGETVAKVDGQDISRQEWDAAHRREIDNRLAAMPNLDRALLESEPVRQATLERMVTERLLARVADKQHLQTTEQRLARELLQYPGIAALRSPDGKLDHKGYEELLRAQGLTPEQFEASIARQLAQRQVLQGVASSAFLPAGAAQPALAAYFERREVQVARFNPADFRAKVQVSDSDVKAYYDTHPEQFKSTEQVDIEYVLLDLDAVARRITLNESDLRAYHEQNNARLSQDEQRRASHILLSVVAGASAQDKAKVKEKAEGLVGELRKNPGRFAELAKANSQDPGSASRGGDLDFFARGTMVKPFEDAAFSMQKGQISAPVESEFGFHILQLTDIRKPAPPAFEAVRAKLEQQLRQQQAQKQYAEAAEVFSNLVYEQSDTFAPVAEKLGLTVRSRKQLEPTGTPGDAEAALLSNPKLLKVLFAEETVRNKRNTEALEVGPNRLLSARVLQHRPAATRPLAEVSAQVRERLVQQRAVELSQAEGKSRLEAWKGGAAASLGAAIVIGRDQVQGLPVPVVTAALSAKVAKDAPTWAGVDLGQAGYAVVRVSKVMERNAPDAARAEQERAQLGQLWNQAESEAFLEALKARHKVKVMGGKSGS